MNSCTPGSRPVVTLLPAAALSAALLLTAPILGPVGGLPAQEPEAVRSETGETSRWARLAAERLPGFEVCRPEGAGEEVVCGRITVWEDRDAREGRRIDLNVVVVPARTEEPLSDPVTLVAGGPGEGVTGAASFVPEAVGELLERRDVLLVDQRGTGRSNGLFCTFGISPENPQPGYDAFFPLDGVRACKEELEQRADLTQYTTSIAVEDLEEVRRRLGYQRLNLVGGSYGTRFVQEFLRRHPESARTAILQGAVRMDHRLPLQHAVDGQRAFDMLFLLCEGDPACREAFPDLRQEFWQVLERLEEEPGRATIDNPLVGGSGGEGATEETGGDAEDGAAAEAARTVELSVGRGMFAESLRSLLYTVQGSTELPFIVHRAHQGDFAPFFRATLPWRFAVETELANGLYLSVTCAEDTVWFDPRDAELQNAGTAVGDLRTDAQRAACGAWPVGEIPEDFHEPVRTDRPVLILGGELDPVTPPRYGREVADSMPRSRFVLIPRGHHSFESLTNQECVEGLMREFILAGSAEGLDTSCVATMQRPPFVVEESGMEHAR